MPADPWASRFLVVLRRGSAGAIPAGDVVRVEDEAILHPLPFLKPPFEAVALIGARAIPVAGPAGGNPSAAPWVRLRSSAGEIGVAVEGVIGIEPGERSEDGSAVLLAGRPSPVPLLYAEALARPNSPPEIR